MNKIPIKITNKPTQSIKLTNLCPTDHIQKPVGEIAINSNGIFNVEKFASANVNVTPPLQNKTATENGIVVADDGYYGLGEVVVDIEGESGVPIVVEELPTPSANTVGKVFLLETKVAPEVGQVVGDKLYFDTSKNPLDYSLGSAIVMGNTDDGVHCTYVDFFALQGITGMGHCYAIGVATPDMSIFLGMPYVYCDVLTVEQFNANVGASLGLSITEFGWQTDVIDITSIKDRKITYVYEEHDFVKIKASENKYYEGITTPIVGKTILYDTSITPNFTNTLYLYVESTNSLCQIVGFYYTDEQTEGQGDLKIIICIFGEGLIVPLYVDGTTNIEVINSLFAEIGISIAEKGWQGNGVIDVEQQIADALIAQGGTAEQAAEQATIIANDTIATYNDTQKIFTLGVIYSLPLANQSAVDEVKAEKDAEIASITAEITSITDDYNNAFDNTLSYDKITELLLNRTTIMPYQFVGR